MPPPRTHRTLWDALVGAATALLVFGAVPGVLVAFVGLPSPHHWTERQIVSWGGLFDLLAVVTWCSWAACAWPILRSVAARVRSGDVASAARFSDRLAARIALGVLASASFLGLGASTTGASVHSTPAAATSTLHSTPAAATSAVQSWTATPSSPMTAAATAPVAASRGSGHGSPTDTRSAAETDPCLVEWGDARERLPAVRYGDVPARHALSGTVRPAAARPAMSSRSSDELGTVDLLSTGSSALPIAELAAAGISALVAGLLARRARQLRRLRAFLREEGARTPEPTEREADLGTFLAPFERVALVDLVEIAARHLRAATATLASAPGPVQWLRAGHDGVEVRFSEPVPDAVEGWRRVGQANWQLTAPLDATAQQRVLADGEPWCATLLPLGDDERGTWLIPAQAGSCVAVVGPRAVELIQAMCAAVRTWTWHEAVVVTDDAQEAADAAAHGSARSAGDRPAGAQVLFVGDPDALSAEARRACAVLTTRQVHDADVTVVVDSRAASAHPLGLSVRPSMLHPSWRDAVDALVDPDSPRLPATDAGGGTVGTDAGADDTGDTGDTEVRDTRDTGDTEVRDTGDTARPLVHGRTAGVTLRIPEGCLGAEVRLLTAIPCIVGLQAELPAKRARRAVEVVAYLAMHAPEPVTGDRLRTRVLGSADADAASKTLFNTVGAARRALGVAADGELLFPPASRSGHYRLSPWVTVDALRACALLRDGLASGDQAESLSRLREGLELVDGEPLGGILTGYAWWRGEGHERRVADAVVDGACGLVRLALGSGELDLARWALAQARKVEPYSESLTRAAMRVAAAAGDASRLHAEWRECQHQMDELDPGGRPSERTERLYALLRRQLAGARAEEPAQLSFAAIDAAPFKTVPSAPSTV